MPDTIDSLVAQTTAEIQRRRSLPEATYRLQFHAGFTFRDAAAHRALPARPGHHPLLRLALSARPGPAARTATTSSITSCLNPEIGSEEDYEAWVAALRDARPGPDPRHRAQPHGHRRPTRTPGGTTCWRTARLALRRLLRHRLALLAAARAAGQGAAARPGRPLRQGARGRAAPAGLRRRRLRDPLLRAPLPGRARAATPASSAIALDELEQRAGRR